MVAFTLFISLYVLVYDAKVRQNFVLHKHFQTFLAFSRKFSSEKPHFANSDFANLVLRAKKSAKENYLALVSFQVLKNVKKNRLTKMPRQKYGRFATLTARKVQ